MIDISKGRYWDLPWSLVSGCTPCSPGCAHCWSAAMTKRFDRKVIKTPGQRDIIEKSRFISAAGMFNGKTKTHPDRLDIPLKRRKPAVYAVWNDLFHEEVPSLFPHHANVRMAQCPQHTFLLLTKRPHVLRKRKMPPIDNVWLGLTVCNQQEADEKIPVFLQVPGKKFLSIEPMLGPIDLRNIPGPEKWKLDALQFPDGVNGSSIIDAVILGGETGPGARPMHPDWVRSVRDQCAAAGVPFFFKQWGEWFPGKMVPYEEKHSYGRWGWISRKGGEVDHYLSRQFEDDSHHELMLRIGRKNSGRLLDGRTHDDLPWRSNG
jgi:protein gp37